MIHARTRLARGRLWHEYIPGLHLEDDAPADRVVPTVSAHGAAMLVRREMLLELGLFDESFFMEWEDLDLCWRAWSRGWPSVYVPEARLRHRVGGATTADVRARRSASSHHNLMRFALKCLPASALARVVAGELLRLPKHPRAIATAFAAARARGAGDRACTARASAAARAARLDARGTARMSSARRIVVVANDHVGSSMAGPGIRYLNFARELRDDGDVTLVVPFETDLEPDGFELVVADVWDPGAIGPLVADADCVVAQRLPVPTMRTLARTRTRRIYDLYAPLHIENLALDARQGAERQPREAAALNRLADAVVLRTGDAFVCASETAARSLARRTAAGGARRPRALRRRPVAARADRRRAVRHPAGAAERGRAGAQGRRSRDRRRTIACCSGPAASGTGSIR